MCTLPLFLLAPFFSSAQVVWLAFRTHCVRFFGTELSPQAGIVHSRALHLSSGNLKSSFSSSGGQIVLESCCLSLLFVHELMFPFHTGVQSLPSARASVTLITDLTLP
jgi:hypothetical protein